MYNFITKLNSTCWVFLTIIGMQFLFSIYAADSIVINEIMAVNNTSIKDEFNEFDDWIELYNPSDNDAEITGMYLSDNKSIPTKFRIGSNDSTPVIISAKSFLIIWADGQPEQGFLHTGFKLKSSGESLFLFASDGATVIDSIAFNSQYGDISFGRYPDADDHWFSLEKPTPKAINAAPQQTIPPAPAFSLSAGFYSNTITIALLQSFEIYTTYFTRDGSDPVEADSLQYRDSIPITSTTVIRARSFNNSHTAGPIATQTFFINETTTLPIVSIVTNPPNLWDIDSGIYVKGNNAEDEYPYLGANYHQDWEKTGNFEFFQKTENSTIYLKNSIKLKIAGGWSRAEPQKSFLLETDRTNGDQRFAFPFFIDKSDIKNLRELFLRASSENGWHLKNELIYKLNTYAESSVSMQSYQPVSVFLNGEYWGIYNLMETKNEEYIETNYNISDFTLIESGGRAVSGSVDEYKSLVDFINSDLAESPTQFEDIDKRIDILNCIDYWFYEIYTGKLDNGNIRVWKPDNPDGKWRWLSYDMDSWNNNNNFERLTTSQKADMVLILGPLLQIPEIKLLFINRFCDLLNKPFLAEHFEEVLDTIITDIKIEMPRQLNRWNTCSLSQWYDEVEWLQRFSQHRPDTLLQQLRERFSLDTAFSVTIKNDNPGQGKVIINTLTIDNISSWSGTYFKGIPITLTAIPAEGFSFTGWNTDPETVSEDVTVHLYSDTILTPHFAPEKSYQNDIRLINPGDTIASPKIIQRSHSVIIEGLSQPEIDLSIYDAKGQLIEHLALAQHLFRYVIFNGGKICTGKPATPGLYLLVMRSTATGKLSSWRRTFKIVYP